MKIKSNYLVYSTLLSIILLSSMSTNESIQVFAQTVDTKFTVRNAEQINKDPFAKSLLEKIEQMKQRIAEVEEAKKKQQEHQKFIDQQRELVKQRLAQDLNRMYDKYKDNTPNAIFFYSLSESKPSDPTSQYCYLA